MLAAYSVYMKVPKMIIFFPRAYGR